MLENFYATDMLIDFRWDSIALSPLADDVWTATAWARINLTDTAGVVTVGSSDFHLDGGATLERHVYALVHAQEMERIGTTTASDIGNLPICPECYVERCVARRQFAPVDKPKQDL